MNDLYFGVRLENGGALPTNKQSFHPSHDDLGTLPTWRPHSWKKEFHGFCSAASMFSMRTRMSTHVFELGRLSVARPVFARVFGPQTGFQKNFLFPSLEGAKSLENQCDLRIGRKYLACMMFLIENNQAYRSMVSCLSQQSDCGTLGACLFEREEEWKGC